MNEKKESPTIGDCNESFRRTISTSQSPALEPHHVEDVKRERRLLRIVDWHLLPMLTMLYTMCLIDRTNLGVARISGIDDDLELTVGSRVSIALLVFYIGYVVMELPSNILIKRFGAANWLSILGIGFGVVTLGIGFSKNWVTLTVLRVFLGIFEAGIWPGCVYLISCWYRAGEMQKRVAVIFISGAFLSSFANILAYGLIHISNDPFNDGWRWIFIVEGALTAAIAILCWFILIDFPGSKRNTFLSPEDNAIIETRLVEQGSSEGEKVTWKIILETVSDWKLWIISFMYATGAVGTYSFLMFLPIIMENSLGFSQQLSFLLSAPPAAFAAILCFALSWVADKVHLRGPFMLFAAIVGTIGLCMIGFLEGPVPRYAGSFLGQAGSNLIIVTGVTWGQNNIRGDAKRAVSTAILVGCSGVAGVYSATVFRQQDAPDYVPGIIATMVPFICTLVLAPIVSFLLWRSNRKADAGLITIQGATGFRYTW